jgi:hypothetical protein
VVQIFYGGDRRGRTYSGWGHGGWSHEQVNEDSRDPNQSDDSNDQSQSAYNAFHRHSPFRKGVVLLFDDDYEAELKGWMF